MRTERMVFHEQIYRDRKQKAKSVLIELKLNILSDYEVWGLSMG